MALSCHFFMDLLCQEMWDPCRESLDPPRSLCSGARKDGGGVLMPKFSPSMQKPGLWLGTVLNSLSL